ncbi:hypothetical protein TI04_08425 [Achromatium sp. WMS2]|nr:hypothetical protein TI04_08425 [Achromatium sp. WMS2]
MDSSSIEIPGMEVSAITLEHNTLTLGFSRAYIIKTMRGSVERTKWWQAGALIFDNVEQINDNIPRGCLVCAGGDIIENVYTYRDMIPIPLESRGKTGCLLRFYNHDAILKASANSVKLELLDVAKYIAHIR